MKQLPYVTLLAVAAFFGFDEYSQIRKELAETKANLAECIKQTTETFVSARQMIEDIRSKLLKQEAALADVQESVQVKLTSLEQAFAKVQAKPEAPKKPRIVMHSSTSCGDCIQWETKDLPVWVKAGWQIEVVKDIEMQSGRWYPWYEITDGDGLQFVVEGKLTKDNYASARRRAAQR